MSLIELWQRPPKSIPEPSYVNRIKDDPDEELVETSYEKRLRQMREWYAMDKMRKLELADDYDVTDRWTAW